MAKRNRIILLSPHPDDAVWSLGGVIPLLQLSTDVLIATLFDGDPASESLARSKSRSERWRLFGDTAARRDEDSKAARRLGCKHLSLGWVDAALRLRPDGSFEQASLDTLLDKSEPGVEAALLDQFERQLGQLILPNDQILAPLGFGDHVDHRITHKLARRLDRTIGYYAEFPYYLPDREHDLIDFITSLDLSLKPLSLTCDWLSWVEASGCYRSQIIRMFGTHHLFIEALTAYANHGGTMPHCRIWSTASR
jgi:LmbE family N-acetylglucosaminyl deacetylase